ncbi:MAG: type II toxin-antitoxin system ParD family antitoxin [Thermoguttaceae bacterium]
METMNIALPEGMKQFVQEQVQKGGFSSVSEYIRDLIRADQKEKAQRALENEILKGIQSGRSTMMTREDWADLREEVRKRHAGRKQA